MAIIRPIINNNGMSKEQHIRLRIEARTAVQNAMKALSELKPHGRDYQTAPDSEAYNRDLAIYTERFAFLDKLFNELMDEAIEIKRQ